MAVLTSTGVTFSDGTALASAAPTISQIGGIVGACYIVTAPSTSNNTNTTTKYSTGLTVAGSSLAYDLSFVGGSFGTNGNPTLTIGTGLVKCAASGSGFTFPSQNTGMGGSFYPIINNSFFQLSGANNATIQYSTLSGSWRSLSSFGVTMSTYTCDSKAVWPMVAWQRYA